MATRHHWGQNKVLFSYYYCLPGIVVLLCATYRLPYPHRFTNMHLFTVMRGAVIALALCSSVSGAAQTPKNLRATALITDAKNNSALQCWEFKSPFMESMTPGTSGSANLNLAQTSSTAYTVIPPHFDGGLHTAPTKQLVVFLSGAANITLPHSSQHAYIEGGKNGLIVANDVMGTGHITKYPTSQQTVTLQIPFAMDSKDGGAEVPAHTVRRRDGPCRSKQQLLY